MTARRLARSTRAAGWALRDSYERPISSYCDCDDIDLFLLRLLAAAAAAWVRVTCKIPGGQGVYLGRNVLRTGNEYLRRSIRL